MRAPIIHVVDDDESFRTAIARLLRATKYEVRTYANANDFLMHLVEGPPGCIVLDLRMPGLGGLELQEVLAAHPAKMPVIFLSGHGDIRATFRAMRAGAIAFLHKPTQPEDLLAAIEKAVAPEVQNRLAYGGSGQIAPELHWRSAPGTQQRRV